jgi:D-alanyl-D-alanine carboxypeptidase
MSGGLEGWFKGVKPDVIIKSVSLMLEPSKSVRREQPTLKTGCTRALALDFVTSVEHGDRQMNAVILGGDSASTPDGRMAARLVAQGGRG